MLDLEIEMEQKPNAERNWSASAGKAAFSYSSTKFSESVNELCHELDKNSNDVKRNFAHTTHGTATSCPADYSIGSLVPRMKNLQLSQKQEPECLAGYVKAVVPPSGTLVIQPAAGSEILDVGTAIFARKIDGANKGYEEIGFVSDIFGCVNEPMYAMQLKQRVDSGVLRLESEVFYSRGHASTRFISVDCNGNDRYTVMHS